MIHVRYEYSFSQAALGERRSGCAPYILAIEPRHGQGGTAQQLLGHVLSVL
jgi:hypothetical protein